MKGEIFGLQLPAFQQSRLSIYIESEGESIVIHCMLHREREGGKGKLKLKERVPLVTECVASYAKRVQYSDKKQ
jgi:hypothetical protein